MNSLVEGSKLISFVVSGTLGFETVSGRVNSTFKNFTSSFSLSYLKIDI